MGNHRDLWHDFPSMQLVRTGSWIRFFGKVTFVVLAVGFLAMFLLPWRQSARCTGNVVALDPQQRPQPFVSPSKGVISYVKPGLREGSQVEEGEILLRIAPIAPEGVQQIESQIAAQQSAKELAELNITVAEQAEELQKASGENMNRSLDQELNAYRQKWEQAKGKVIELVADKVDKENSLSIAERTIKDGLISQEELFSKRQAAEAARQKVLNAETAAEEAYSLLESKEKDIESKRQEIDIKNRTASQKVLEAVQKLRSIEKELITLETKRDELERLVIKAPRSGIIQNWYGLTGSDAVKEGDQLFVLVPETTDLAIEMKIAGNDLPLIAEGDPVRLQFEGFPAVQSVGWPSTAVGTFPGKVNRIYPTDDGLGNFRVIVTPPDGVLAEEAWPDRRYIRQGVRVNGWVLLGQVTLGYEIWRQLNGFAPENKAGDQPVMKDKSAKPKLPKP